jgi:hypothetical protein
MLADDRVEGYSTLYGTRLVTLRSAHMIMRSAHMVMRSAHMVMRSALYTLTSNIWPPHSPLVPLSGEPHGGCRGGAQKGWTMGLSSD